MWHTINYNYSIINCSFSRFLHSRFPQVDSISDAPRPHPEKVFAETEKAFRQTRSRFRHLHSQVVFPVLPWPGKTNNRFCYFVNSLGSLPQLFSDIDFSTELRLLLLKFGLFWFETNVNETKLFLNIWKMKGASEYSRDYW